MGLSFKHISHLYNGVSAITDVSLDAASGEILCLLGPSGCGKTTLLNLAAGILSLQVGDIYIDDNILATPRVSPPPEKRPIGLVFQEGALFPHMTVEQNIAFGLARNQNRKAVVSDLLRQIGLSGFGNRYPHTLSGGQQQRVAVARALAPRPPVLLMDEPFANIDIALRRRLREDIRHVLKTQNCVTIMVTHDPEEAMEISDKIAIMDQGKIVQVGRPDEIYESPASLAVAQLTGDGAVLRARRSKNKLVSDFGIWPLDCLTTKNHADVLDLYIRPASTHLAMAETTENALIITDVRQTGRTQFVTLKANAHDSLMLQLKSSPKWTVGQSVQLIPETHAIIGFPA